MEVHLYINMQVYILCIESICTNNDIFNVLGSPTKLKTVDLKVAKKKSVANIEVKHTYMVSRTVKKILSGSTSFILRSPILEPFF